MLSNGSSRACAVESAPLKPTSSLHVPSRAVVGALESLVVRAQIRHQLPSSDDHTSDSTSTPELPQPREKKRKPTYYMRKEEMTQLQDEIERLRTQLQQFETHTSSVGVSLDYNAALRSHVQQGDLAIATAQSLMASYGTQRCNPPLGGYIHLPSNALERQRTLAKLKPSRIQEAVTYTLARTAFLNVGKITRQTELFETDSGDYVTTHWEITPLEDALSVKHAFQELLYFVETQEMTLSEKLGVLTIRESESEPMEGAQVIRMLSKYDNGTQVESNLAVFTEYFEKSELVDQPHALMVTDFVNKDDLYPFQPKTRIHKDVMSVTMITEVPATRGSDKRLITLIRWAFVRVNHSPYASRQDREYIVRGGIDKWCDVMLKCIRERLAWRA